MAKKTEPKLYFEEVEIGPHFVTFYTRMRSELIAWLPGLYHKFLRDYNFARLWEIQQEGFVHVADDPKVYHPYGDPQEFREAYSHFHIRTATEPSEGLVSELIAFTEKHGAAYPDVVPIFKLEDKKIPGKRNKVYPPRRIQEDYFNYIERIKAEDLNA